MIRKGTFFLFLFYNKEIKKYYKWEEIFVMKNTKINRFSE